MVEPHRIDLSNQKDIGLHVRSLTNTARVSGLIAGRSRVRGLPASPTYHAEADNIGRYNANKFTNATIMAQYPDIKPQHDKLVRADRLLLRPVVAEDLSALHRMRLNPMVKQFN